MTFHKQQEKEGIIRQLPTISFGEFEKVDSCGLNSKQAVALTEIYTL